MNTHDTLLNAALQVLEEEGEAQFSTRSVCAIAKVTAPTLYHHFGSADGLLSAAITEAFAQFLESKRTATQSSDPVMALREGWDDYVRFAAIAAEGRLRPTVEVAADLMWASANAASLLYVTARLRKVVPPTSEVLEQIREGAIRSILNPEQKGRTQ
ncbi:TetR/AcrR family transcriptional regulator [Paenibacillus planticolens]|uniref:TetR family transcriptional regulator n=1 Tax=Paenibacillus planticolens TaxID=2654976 RepID=A0ABX1ZKQ8_9BACL|nr:TetR/AcrR family transcriptional regulator [Paenibacillus planticolens]NOV00684.1 TetR family transcriptional regulator [Paenibacillus planticolens]